MEFIHQKPVINVVAAVIKEEKKFFIAQRNRKKILVSIGNFLEEK